MPKSGRAASGRQPGPSAHNDARFRRLFDSNSVGIQLCDVDGHITDANDAFLGMLGYERGDLPLRWDLMTPPEWRDLDETKVQEVLSTGAGLAWEKQYFARDGRRVQVLVSVALLDKTRGECVAIVHDLSERVRLEASLGQRTTLLGSLATRLMLVEENERRRIARGLHDDIGHTLALAKLRVGQLQEGTESTSESPKIRDVHELLNKAIESLRSLTFELGSPVLYELGFQAALRSIGEELEHGHGIRFRFRAEQPGSPDGESAILLYRIVRELFKNVATHAQASCVALSVETTDERVRIAVEDDGVGFDCTGAGERFGPSGGFGLFSINEQLRVVGGALEIDSAPGRGTRVVIVAPLASNKGIAT